MSLREYQRKRDFAATSEPKGTAGKRGRARRFVVQKHAASRLHYDFRLEIDGTLKSWAVPRGIPFVQGEKQLAVEVEDHPVSYIDFEGTIPKGQYGGGTVMVWDRGTFETTEKSPAQSLQAGKLHFSLQGTKLQGAWHLVRLRDAKQWLLIKGSPGMRPISKKLDDTSARSGKSMKELESGGAIWNSKPAAEKTGRPVKMPRTRNTAARPKFVTPMLAKPVATLPAGEWQLELKFDGYRALILKRGDEIRLLSRNEKDLGAKFPEILNAARKLNPAETIIDGEIVAVDAKGRSSFQLLQQYALGETRPALLYYAFDLLELDGEDFKSKPLEARKAALERSLPKQSLIRFSASLDTDVKTLLAQVRKLGLEGLIGKRAKSRYEPGQRSGNWIKLKVIREQEFVIGGYTDPEGARTHFGSLLLGVYQNHKLHFVGKVGTGFGEKLLVSLKRQMDREAQAECPFVNLPEKKEGRYGQGVTRAQMKRCHWVKPRLVGQVKFFEWTQDGKLRQPAFLGLRDDKSPREVVRETP